MEYYDGDMFRMDACRFCRCQGGVSICFSAQCGELHCDRYYVPEGECCPVCEGEICISLVILQAVVATSDMVIPNLLYNFGGLK